MTDKDLIKNTIKILDTRNNKRLCKCINKHCNNTTTIQWSHRKKSLGLCKPCGRVSCSKKLSVKYSNAWRKLRRSFSSKDKKYLLKISREEFYKLCEHTKCHYCYTDLNRAQFGYSKDGNKSYMLDRKNNNKPYTLSNCVPCCWACNRLKSNVFTYKQFKILRCFIKEKFNI